MVARLWARGWPACGYLFLRYLRNVVLLAAVPIGLLLAWMIPAATAGLVRLANAERNSANWYLGREQGPPLPAALPREPGDVATLFRDKSFKRSLWVLLGPLVMVPELVIAVAAISAIPSALI